MDIQKIINKLCDEGSDGLADLKEGKLQEATNKLYKVTRKIDHLIEVMKLDK